MWALSPMLVLSKGSPKFALSRLTYHYPRVDLVQNWAKLTLCKGGFGPKFSKVGTIGGGFGPTFGEVDTIGGGFGPKFGKVVTIGGGFGPKFGKVGTIVAKIRPSGHYRGWKWSKGGFGHTIEG